MVVPAALASLMTMPSPGSTARPTPPVVPILGYQTMGWEHLQ